jgi:hypothetical protein
MANNNTLIVAIVLIAVIVVGALAVTTLFKSNDPVTAESVGATKLAFQNNGTTWLHMDVILENVTLKNGTLQTFYNEMWIKPNGTVVIDISNLAGYGDSKLPPGTTIRILAWKNLFNNTTATSTGDLNLNMQGWSGTLQPGANDTVTNVIFPGLKVNLLPTNVTDNMLFTDIDMIKLEKQQGFIDDHDQNCVFEEEILTVDQNGKVTITVTTTPELCSIIAHLI